MVTMMMIVITMVIFMMMLIYLSLYLLEALYSKIQIDDDDDDDDDDHTNCVDKCKSWLLAFFRLEGAVATQWTKKNAFFLFDTRDSGSLSALRWLFNIKES